MSSKHSTLSTIDIAWKVLMLHSLRSSRKATDKGLGAVGIVVTKISLTESIKRRTGFLKFPKSEFSI